MLMLVKVVSGQPTVTWRRRPLTSVLKCVTCHRHHLAWRRACSSMVHTSGHRHFLFVSSKTSDSIMRLLILQNCSLCTLSSKVIQNFPVFIGFRSGWFSWDRCLTFYCQCSGIHVIASDMGHGIMDICIWYPGHAWLSLFRNHVLLLPLSVYIQVIDLKIFSNAVLIA